MDLGLDQCFWFCDGAAVQLGEMDLRDEAEGCWDKLRGTIVYISCHFRQRGTE